ncbi:MAG: hypothetical protein WCT39_01550 [Candidatus Margulisiibacteriota bacterium]
MVKKIWSLLLVSSLVLAFSSASFSVMKGLEKESPDVVKVGEGVEVPAGQQVGSAVAVGGPVTVRGHVQKDAVAVGGSVHLKNKSFVGGNAVSVGGTVHKSSGAVVKGDITEIPFSSVLPKCGPLSSQYLVGMLALLDALMFIWAVILAMVFVAFFTSQMGRVSVEMEKSPVKTFFIGLLIALLVIPIGLLLVFSIIGIALIPLWILALASAGLLGGFSVAHLIGKKLLYALRIYGKSMMVETLAGVITLFLLGMVPILGPLVKFVACMCGLGAVYNTRFGTR